MLDKGNVYILTADNVLPDPDKTLSTVKMCMLALSSIISGYQLLTNFLMVLPGGSCLDDLACDAFSCQIHQIREGVGSLQGSPCWAVPCLRRCSLVPKDTS
jgi:hypothetical protein